jgi:CBS domain-containing protein
MQTCREVMTRDPICCEASASVQDAARMMLRENIGSVPVISNGRRLVGIVTDRDLAINVVAQGLNNTSTTVEQVMTRDPVFCHPDDDLQRAMNAMGEFQIRRIPIVDENHQIIGIVSQADLAIRGDNKHDVAEVVEEVSKPLG